MKARRAVSAEELAYYRAHLREAIREDGVVCLECGQLFRALTSHLRKHSQTLDDYRERWGYNRTNPLMVPGLVEWRRQWAIATNLAGFSPPGILEKAHEAWRKGRPLARLEARLNRSDDLKARVARGWRSPNLKVPDEAMRALAQEGLAVQGIVARTGLNKVAVWQRLRRLGLIDPRPPRPPIDAKDAELLALRQAGLWDGEIAKRTGMNVGTVRSRLARLRQRGVTVPTPPGPPPTPGRKVTDDQLLACACEGLRVPEIAARLGLYPSSVRVRLAALRRRGLLPAAPSRQRGDGPPIEPAEGE